MTTVTPYPTYTEQRDFTIGDRVRVSAPSTSVSSYYGATGTVRLAVARSSDARLVWWQVKLDDGRTQLFYSCELTKI